MSETTKEYFEREKESRFDLIDYIDSSDTEEKVEIARKILWDEVDTFVEYETDDEYTDWSKIVDEFASDLDWLDEAIKNYYDPLSIERRVRVDPRDPYDIEDRDDSKYKILITYGWPNVFFEIDFTAELHLYWWGEHYSRDFWADFADKLLSFYWLE